MIEAHRERCLEDEKDDAMNSLARLGFWTCAAIYTAIGVIGVFLLSAQPDVANSMEGYGTIHPPAQK
jgi:hypothetical protein